MPDHSLDPVRWEKHVAKQVTIWQVRKGERSDADKSQPPTSWNRFCVAVSRLHGAGGDDVAHELGCLLHWPVYDRELVHFIAENAHVRSQVVESFDEKRRSEIETWLQTTFSHEMLGIDRYGKHLLAVLATLSEHGQAILVGRGSPFILKPEQGVRVLISAPQSWRGEQMAQKRGISHKEALSIIHKVDSDRLAFSQKYFHRNPDDPEHYDLVINTQQFTPAQAARVILAAMEQKAGAPFTEGS